MNTLNKALAGKLDSLRDVIRGYEKPCIAFSGGVDSTLLLRVAVETRGAAAVPMTVNGSMMPRSEFGDAKALAQSMGASLCVLDVDVFSVPEFVENGSQRCYYCKKNIFTQIKGHAQELGCDVIFDGSNLDDLDDYRPGLLALEEMMVVSPFIKAGLTKQDIRGLSAFYGLPTADKPAMACLATRIPGGEPITRKKLLMVEQGEECLKVLGLRQYRLRYIGSMAKIECAEENFELLMERRQELVSNLKAIGFKTVTLDLSGYQCGSMNEVKK